MKIGIDIQSIYGQKTGIGTYVSYLLEGLPKVSEDMEYVTIDSFWKVNHPTPYRLFYDQVERGVKAYLKHVDLLHVPGFSAPYLYRGKKIITCHDLIPLFYNISDSSLSNIYWEKIIFDSMKHCDGIIAVSKTTKQDIMNVLGIPEEKICVIYNGSDESYKPLSGYTSDEIEQVKRKFNLPDKFALYVGTIEARKNVDRLVRVVQHLDIPLVIAGRTWKGAPLPSGRGITATGYISDFEKKVIYALATIFIMPSLYEGFGIPVVEAMHAGVPVVCSQASSLPEIAGNAAVFFDPLNEEDMAEKIKLVYNNSALREELITKGFENVKRFSWEKMCEETAAYYREILEK